MLQGWYTPTHQDAAPQKPLASIHVCCYEQYWLPLAVPGWLLHACCPHARGHVQAATRVLAKSLVRLRGQVTKLQGQNAALRGVSTQITVSAWGMLGQGMIIITSRPCKVVFDTACDCQQVCVKEAYLGVWSSRQQPHPAVFRVVCPLHAAGTACVHAPGHPVLMPSRMCMHACHVSPLRSVHPM